MVLRGSESLQVEGIQEARKEQRKGLWGWWAVGLPAVSGMEQKEVWEVRPERQVGQVLRA